jgi:hypothetical protein
MMGSIEFTKVNKMTAGWSPKLFFRDFRIRAILVEEQDVITKIDTLSRLRRRLERELGEEDKEWILIENFSTGEDELYLRDSSVLVMWKLQNDQKFKELFERVEENQV